MMMPEITSAAQLKTAIVLFEVKQAKEECQLKEQFDYIFESLKPVNIIKNAFKEIKAPALNAGIIDTAIGMSIGYLAKKALAVAFHNPFIKLFGILLQVGVSNFVSKHPDVIKSSGQHMLKRIFRKRRDEDFIKSE